MILLYFNYVCLCVGMCMCDWVSMEYRRGTGTPRDGVTGCCELPDMGAEKQAHDLCKSSMCSQPPTHHSSPLLKNGYIVFIL